MIHILAVADQRSHYLDFYLTSPQIQKENFDFLFSCGDLDYHYIDFLATNTGQIAYYVDGNHDIFPKKSIESSAILTDFFGNFVATKTGRSGFGVDLHGRIVVDKGFILCGFGGALGYRDGAGQFRESVMQRITRRVARRIKFQRWLDRVFGKPAKEVIVLSHTPPENLNMPNEMDSAHQGFRCFKTFIENIQPLLWLHGHIHLGGFNQIQKTDYGKTIILNVYEFKSIAIDNGQVEIGYRLKS